MSDAAPIEVEQRDGVTILRLARPAQRNALVAEMRAALTEAIPAFFADAGAGCLLLTGMGESFCAGGDLKTFSATARPQDNRARIQYSQNWAAQLLTGQKPVVMAVNGAAVGAGFGLAMLGDVVLAGAGAFFQPAFPLVAMVPDLALGQTLPRAVGSQRARDILLTNRRVDAAEAGAIGLVARVVADDQLFDEAFTVARRLAQGPRLALGLTKALVRQGFDLDTPAYFELEAAYQAVAMGSADHAEGLDAFIAKRRPRFGAEEAGG